MGPRTPTKKVNFLGKNVFKYSNEFKVWFIITEKEEIPTQWVRLF